MVQTLEMRRLGVVQHVPAERLRLLVVNAVPDEIKILQSLFPSSNDASLEIAPTAARALSLLSIKPYDLVALDPAITFGGFALLKYVKENYRWTATLIATNRQDPEFLREAIHSRVDGLLFRPTTPDEMIEQALLLGREVSARRSQQQKRVLAIGAHPDDVEIGCGGALAKHYADYDVVHILTLSRVAAGGDVNTRLIEARNAAAMIGAELTIENHSDTNISGGAETISIIEAAINEMQATHVYTHSIEDTHQDHRAVHAATLVAARGVPTVYCYQAPSSTVDFKPQRFVDITRFIDKKMDLIGAYKSQISRMVSLQPDVILSTARYWGRFAGHVLAEPLVVIRERDSDSDLPRSSAISLTAVGETWGSDI